MKSTLERELYSHLYFKVWWFCWIILLIISAFSLCTSQLEPSAERKEEKAGSGRNIGASHLRKKKGHTDLFSRQRKCKFHLFLRWQFRPFIVQHYQIVKKKHWMIIQIGIVVLTKKIKCLCPCILNVFLE